jgi:DnaJ homolog subfamily C member 19
MTFKFLAALAIVYLAWRIWHGIGPLPGTPKPAPAPLVDPAQEEARAVLGIEPGAGEAEIRAAHRRLIQAVHPDRGGSAELTRRINAARDTLLRQR